MNLAQRKLNKSEWNSVEISVSEEEKKVLNLIKDGYHNLNLSYNDNNSLADYLKIENTIGNEVYIYEIYFKKIIDKLIEKYNLTHTVVVNKNKNNKINKVNQLRIESNSNESLKQRDDIFEFVLLEITSKSLKHKKNDSHRWCYYYYTLCKLLNYEILNVNTYVLDFCINIISLFRNDINKKAIIARSTDYIEKNEYILKYRSNNLFDHQKQIYSIYRNKQDNESTLILYTAPTATGKTLTPLGLSEQYKIIFVCAARHVGVSLAKSAISIGKKVAFAFGCECVEDIRLHYFSAKEYERNYKSGGIFRVDNTVGDNVEIMITDIKSYLIAMNYMNAFNDLNKLILFWDEPTITLDYESHECHDYISEIWKKNIIPNVILSSATLPEDDDIQEIFQDFIEKYDFASISRIRSIECKKTIPIINSEGYVEVPHYRFKDFNDLRNSINYINSNKTILRYLDLNEIIKFIIEVEENIILEDIYKIDNYFDSIHSISMETIKLYYIELLNQINEENWLDLYDTLIKKRVKIINNNSSGSHITTSDAYTLTDGPTIYIAEDVNKIAKFCIQTSKIPNDVINNIMSGIKFNKTLNTEIEKNSKEVEDKIQKYLDSGSEKKLGKLDSFDDTTKGLIKKGQELNKLYKSITLNDLYVPNKLPHYQRWGEKTEKTIFTSDIDNEDVERVMNINDVDDIWKLLLLMGIGLFSRDMCIPYTEIVKEFADKQKLYLIIANGDYIYGTNYQFCHSFLSKDLENMTQEKIIQAIGRVGRNKLQHDYSIRFRNDSLIDKIFIKEENKIEVSNMKKLLKS